MGSWTSQVGLVIKNLSASAGDIRDMVQSLHPEESMATHSSILAWSSPWTEKFGGLQFIRLQRVRHD